MPCYVKKEGGKPPAVRYYSEASIHSGTRTKQMTLSNPLARESLIGRDFVRRLRRHILSRVDNAHECDDIFQETVARVLARLDTSDLGAEDVQPYAFRVASNLIHDRYRRGVHQVIEVPDSLESEFPQPERHYAARSELAEMMKVIDAMPSLRRRVFILVRVDGQSHKEVSEALGISLKAIEKHMTRALGDIVLARRRLTEQPKPSSVGENYV